MQKTYRIKMASPNLQSLLFFEKYTIPLKRTYLPRQRKKFVLQKSPFVQSKAKEHFQIVIHKRFYLFRLDFLELKELLLNVPCDTVIKIEQVLTF